MAKALSIWVARPLGFHVDRLTGILRPRMSGFERPRYFTGKLITAEDFELEQRYHIEKRCLLNRMLQGAGVVSGLTVVGGEQGTVTVAPGFAIDPLGREILVSESQKLTIGDCAGRISICLLYTEIETDRGTICETYELMASRAPVPEGAVVLGVVEGVIDPDSV
jgi:hypothetical protein